MIRRRRGRPHRQHLAFQQLEAGATAGGDVGHLLGQASFFDSCDGVATAMTVQQPLALRSARVVAMALVPAANLSNSNTPMGPFQPFDNRGASWNTVTGQADVQAHPAVGTAVRAPSAVGVGGEVVGQHNAEVQFHAFGFGLGLQPLASSSLSSTRLLPTARPRAL